VLRAFFDPGSGQLLWAKSEPARARFDYDVDHHELPIPSALASRIDARIERHDHGNPDLKKQPPRPWEEVSWAAFRAEYELLIAELRTALGPDYDVLDEARLPEHPPLPY
jgi:hypothetical protein